MSCSTCNHKTFVKDVKEVRGVMIEFLRNENHLIDISCDMQGENFKIGALRFIAVRLAEENYFDIEGGGFIGEYHH